MAAIAPGSSLPRAWWLVLVACPLLAIVGLLTHRVVFPWLALALCVTLAMLPALMRRQLAPWLLWLGLQAALLILAVLGFAGVALEAAPAVVNAALAWLFARSLSRPRPLIACCVVAVDGEARLREPGVARYARQLTVFWATLLAVNALLLAWLLVFAQHVGLLARLGVESARQVDAWWAAGWLNVGGYVLPAVLFVAEYGYRRWRWRHLQHLGLPQMLLRLAAQWPRLLRDQDATG